MSTSLSFKEIVLYEVVGESACVDNIVIIPAFYEIAIEATTQNFKFEFSLNEYMVKNGCTFSKICPDFHQFSEPYSKLFETSTQCDAIWVRAKIPAIYKFYPPAAVGWRYELLNLPFLAVLLNDSRGFPSIHPFACIEEDLKAGLEFYPVTNSEQCLRIANAFWKILLSHQTLIGFVDVVLGDWYDDYASVVMGNDFVAGYWNNEFHLYGTAH